MNSFNEEDDSNKLINEKKIQTIPLNKNKNQEVNWKEDGEQYFNETIIDNIFLEEKIPLITCNDYLFR